MQSARVFGRLASWQLRFSKSLCLSDTLAVRVKASLSLLAVAVLEGSLPFGYGHGPGDTLAWPPGIRVPEVSLTFG